MNTFAFRLKEYRRKKNLKSKDAATLIGVPVSTYRGWENGTNISKCEYYVKIASAFEIPLSDLMTGKGRSNSPLSEIIVELENSLKKLKEIAITLN